MVHLLDFHLSGDRWFILPWRPALHGTSPRSPLRFSPPDPLSPRGIRSVFPCRWGDPAAQESGDTGGEGSGTPTGYQPSPLRSKIRPVSPGSS